GRDAQQNEMIVKRYMSKGDLAQLEVQITFLTEGDDPNDDDVVLKKLFHPNLKLLIVIQGSGCRYYTK
ncbi:hypothetical protein S83_032650, partial [Arachis hypogaea]